jgi:hypothetical protein
VRAAVVSDRDPAPIAETAEGIFDPVALTVDVSVACDRTLASRHRRDPGGDAAGGETGTEAIAVLAAVGEQ